MTRWSGAWKINWRTCTNESRESSATIRYSQDTGHGAWKVIELGAEASVSDREFWKQAQSELYYQLGDQLRQLWHNGTSAALNGAGGAETAIAGASGPEPSQTSREHWCQTHNVEFKRRTKDRVVWYSHRQGSAWPSRKSWPTLPTIPRLKKYMNG